MKQKAAYQWLIKYKLYHIPFWLAYHIMWWTVSSGSIADVLHNIFYSPYSVKFLFYVIFQAAGVYFNLYFLMPKFLEKGKYLAYVAGVLATIICVAFLIIPGYYASSWLSGHPFQDLYGKAPSEFMYFFKINTLPSSAASMTLGMSVKLAKNWIQTRKRQQLLEKEKLETELKFLKSQFNPHFLFNSINSIFVLIHKNPDMASESLAKFSDLLRYQLYECNEAEIPLSQEIVYIENFIELEKLRQESNIRLNIDLQYQQAGNIYIAPFILMPFIENAFKHVSKKQDDDNWINLKLRYNEDEICMCVSNSVSEKYHSSNEPMRFTGIGLKNVKRRLHLLYLDKHEIEIAQTTDSFNVTLRISFNHAKTRKDKAPLMELTAT